MSITIKDHPLYSKLTPQELLNMETFFTVDDKFEDMDTLHSVILVALLFVLDNYTNY